MTNSIQKIVKNNAMLIQVQEQMQDFIEKRTWEIFRKIQNESKNPTEGMASIRFRDEIEAQLSFDFLRAFSGYCLKTDEVKIISNTPNAKGFNVVADVQRNGETFRINTTLIGAGGFNVQRFHFRYIVKTNLPKTENLFIEMEKKMTSIDNAILKFRDLSNAMTRLKVELYESQLMDNKKKSSFLKKDINSLQKQIDEVVELIEELRK